MLLHPGVVGGALEGEVESELEADALGGTDEPLEIGDRAELGMDGVVAAVFRADRVGEPGSFGPASRLLLGPLRNVVPIGWTGGMYTTSNPIREIAGSRRAAVRKVPDCQEPSGSFLAPSLRGKNSYQLPTPARARSTRTLFFGLAVTRLARG
ncbi:hypothetical protein GCM10025867_33880 [Frondihabitans sucicola]|uniref:Uncharacterized protein n=1 Tax=Frondihabitans sucicola TaxID=1268041 RepID=A0ABM8GRV4_9MICO|nr:hypothetical protein GCM10025867_33880 [Frondihabitans sucicola]